MRIIQYKVFYRGYNVVKFADDVYLVYIDCPPYENVLQSEETVDTDELVMLYRQYMDWYEDTMKRTTYIGVCLTNKNMFPQKVTLTNVEDSEYLGIVYNVWEFDVDFQDFIIEAFKIDSKECIRYVELVNSLKDERG